MVKRKKPALQKGNMKVLIIAGVVVLLVIAARVLLFSGSLLKNNSSLNANLASNLVGERAEVAKLITLEPQNNGHTKVVCKKYKYSYEFPDYIGYQLPFHHPQPQVYWGISFQLETNNLGSGGSYLSPNIQIMTLEDPTGSLWDTARGPVVVNPEGNKLLETPEQFKPYEGFHYYSQDLEEENIVFHREGVIYLLSFGKTYFDENGKEKHGTPEQLKETQKAYDSIVSSFQVTP